MKAIKRISILLVFSVLVLTGCTQDKVEEISVIEEGLKASVIDENWEVIRTESFFSKINSKPPVKQNRVNPNQIATGDFIAALGTSVEFSAIMNRGGVHGNIYWDAPSTGELHAIAICVSSNNDGEAVTAYLIKTVEFPFNHWQVNNIFFRKLKDNGEGNNSPPDNYSEYAVMFFDWFDHYNTPEEFLADGFSCDDLFNSTEFGGWYEVAEGQIKVQ